MEKKSKNRINLTTSIIVLFLLILGIEFYIYSYEPVLRGDEAAYCYVLNYEKNGIGLGYGIGEDQPMINNVGDIINSQIDHYKYWGGRNLVHAVEQFFSGVSTPATFYLINTFIFLLAIILIVYVSTGIDIMFNSIGPWLITIGGIIYFLPWSLYIMSSINLACNYLWPMIGFLLIVSLWRYVRKHKTNYNLFISFLLFLISFVAGWSHEAYCLPLSGAFFFYYLFRIKEFKGIQKWIVIGFWIGSIVLFLSPGNFKRMDDTGKVGDLNFYISEFIFALPRFKLVYIFLITLLFFRIRRKDIYIDFVKNNKLIILSWILGFIFISFLHTVSQSFTGIELISLLLTVSLCKPLFKRNKNRNIVSGILIFLVCIHVGFISYYEFKQNQSERETLLRYAISPDGITLNYTKVNTNPFISPFLRQPIENFRDYPLVEKIYADNPNSMILITPEDEKIIKFPQKYFIEDNKFGDGPFYAIDGVSKVWAPADSSLLKHEYLWIFDKPKWNERMSMRDRVNAIINPDTVPKTMTASKPRIISTKYGLFTMINIPTERKIIGIKTKK